ncbi:hypothetical protein EKH57_14430 [Halorubrum sp. BOL3-1]|uniref:hypothetical protein n=1 Tax=Halorubrum sp. BOL3-1 TaxID=2497325 RepID=UPI0010051D33|nr:hypothetical protein [Halorubrum sp. BOL3-1]QAU13819.1 hypothetical protein EKH57_14430 [Halorubrum sp. BOL3-1]
MFPSLELGRTRRLFGAGDSDRTRTGSTVAEKPPIRSPRVDGRRTNMLSDSYVLSLGFVAVSAVILGSDVIL